MPQSRKRQKCRLDKDLAHIVIIGSLSAAISLEQAGFQGVSVYELEMMQPLKPKK
jgi:hypothetical protein